MILNNMIKIQYMNDVDFNTMQKTDKKIKIVVTYNNGSQSVVPLDEANTDYQEIQKWVEEGNTIEEAD